jgi:pectate lyase
VTGGAGGEPAWVTSLADAGPGTLRELAAGDAPRWIRFGVSGPLRLASPLAVGANKTIDGRGARVLVTRHGLVVAGVTDVVIANLLFADGAGDALHVTEGAARVWIHHCSFARWEDGCIDVTRAATDVTVSWCRFTEHEKVLLVGASPAQRGDVVMRVTLHHNYFARTAERHPRLRFGKVHAYNNYHERWRAYGAAASMEGELRSEANVYEAAGDPDAVLVQAGRDPAPGFVRSIGDLALGGARIIEREPARVFDPSAWYASAVVEPADASLRARVAAGAGWRDGRRPD